MSTSWFLFLIICILHICVLYGQNATNYTNRTATIGYGGMVASAHYLATEAGLKILREGGNAADAALAVQLTLNLVQPMMSGIGGGCFIMYYDYENKTVYAIDGREEAPDAYHSKIFCKNPDCLDNEDCDCSFGGNDAFTADYNERRVGGLSVGVPGTLYAYYRLHKHFGIEDWQNLFQPAIDLSFDGFPMYTEMYQSLLGSRSYFERFNESYHLYFDTETGLPKAEIGDLFYNQKFGNLLKDKLSLDPDLAIQEFYTGDIAQEIVKAVQNNPNQWTYNDSLVERPGLMTMEDINGYRAVFREVVESMFGPNEDDNGTMYKMYGMNMPSSGGATVQYMMNLMYSLINDEELSYLNGSKILNENISSVDNIHYLTTTNNIAFSDRNQYMADSDFIYVPVDGLIDFDYINERAKELFDENYVETPIPFGYPDGSHEDQTSRIGEEHGTSHFFVVDQWNNIATVTTTIEGAWGSVIVVPKYGFLLNNELTDFDVIGHTANGTRIANGPEGGKVQRSTALDIFPIDSTPDSETLGGKRPRSSMSPSLLLNANTMEPVLSVGSPGGWTIIGTTFETMFNVLLREMDVQRAIDAVRLWTSNSNFIRVEERLWNENTNLGQELQERGYDLNLFQNVTAGGRCQAVRFYKSDHCDKSRNFYLLYGGADDRRWSTANVSAVCLGDGTNYDSTSIVCAMECIEISQLTSTQRIVLITLWLIALITVLCIVMNRDRIKKWKEKRKIKKLHYFNQENDEPTDQYIGDDTEE